MTRETKVGLLVGMAFIICFGIILGETRTAETEPNKTGLAGEVPTPAGFSEMPYANLRVEERRVRLPEQAVRVERTETPRVRTPQPAAPVRPIPAPIPRPVQPVTPMVPTPRPAAPAVQPPAPPAPVGRSYTVVAGDSLYKIARKVYGPGGERYYRKIFEANRATMRDESSIYVGQKLVIPNVPGAAAVRSSAADPRTTPTSPVGSPRRSLPGVRTMGPEEVRDYLRSLGAPRTAPTVPTPASVAGPARRNPAGRSRTYTVRRGDSLTAIARKLYGETSAAAVRKIVEANRSRLPDPNRLGVGMVLVIPPKS